MKKNIFIACFIVIFGATFYTFIYKKYGFRHKTAQANQTIVKVTPVIEKKLPNVVHATGTLIANASAIISAKLSGYVTEIYFKEGEQVKAGTPLIQLDNRAEQDALASAKAAAQLSEIQYERYKIFLDKGFITQDVFYNTKVTRDQNLTSVTDDLNKLNDKTIRAPFNGEVGIKNISIGQYVAAGSKLTTLVDASQLKVEYTLPSEYQSLVSKGQAIEISSEAYPNQIFKGQISFIDTSIDPETQNIMIHAVIDNANHLLKPGQFVRIAEHLGLDKKVLLVPSQSVLADLNGYYVFTVQNSKAIKTTVKVGDKFYQQVEITKGLYPNEPVISAGQSHLHDGCDIKIVQS